MIFNDQQQAILRTLSFFDLFRFPLTSLECWRLLYYPTTPSTAVSLVDIKKELVDLSKQQVVKNTNDFWQLSSSPNYYDLRQDRYRIAAKKIARLKLWKHIFSWLPSVRLIAVVNSVGYRNPEVDDDIDLLIITKSGKLWLTRGWLTGLAKLFGARPTIDHQQDGLCLSFYLSDNHLSVGDLLIDHPDVYFHFWLTQMTVFYDDGVGAAFIEANSKWQTYFPNLNLKLDAVGHFTWFDKLMRSVGMILTLSVWEPIWKGLQIKMLPKNLGINRPDKGVIINDQVLKFHDQDRRLFYLDKWRKKLGEMGI